MNKAVQTRRETKLPQPSRGPYGVVNYTVALRGEGMSIHHPLGAPGRSYSIYVIYKLTKGYAFLVGSKTIHLNIALLKAVGGLVFLSPTPLPAVNTPHLVALKNRVGAL